MKTKKLLIGTLLLLATISLTGCGNKAKVDGKNTVELKGAKISANEFYDSIKEDEIEKLVEMIDHKLFDKKYATTDEENKEVEKQITNIKKAYANDNDNEEYFESILKQYFGVNNQKELEAKLHLQEKRKLAVEDYIKDNLTDREIENYYNNNVFGQMKASHILIRSEADASASDKEKKEAEEKAKKEAEEIIEKINKGEKFSDLAKKYSDDEATASKGGDLGYFDLDSMTEQFSEATKKLKVKEYTKEPVKTEYGYHIILKTGEKKKKKLDKVKDDIKEKLKEEKMNADTAINPKTLVEIRKSKKIKWNDPALKKAYNRLMEKEIKNASGTVPTE